MCWLVSLFLDMIFTMPKEAKTEDKENRDDLQDSNFGGYHCGHDTFALNATAEKFLNRTVGCDSHSRYRMPFR
jgi:hypothetical protein